MSIAVFEDSDPPYPSLHEPLYRHLVMKKNRAPPEKGAAA